MFTYIRGGRRSVRLSILLYIVAGSLHAQDSTSAPSDSSEKLTVEQRLEELDQRIRVLSRLREIAEDSIATAAKSAQIVTANGKDGFSLKSADGSFALKVRGYIQSDGRFFAGYNTVPATSSILLRRVRPIFEGTLYKRFDFRVMPDFGGTTPTIYDAYSELRLWPALAIRAGKFKPPIGLERLQSATDIKFVERGLPTNLVPNRDVGLQLSGELSSGILLYQAGVFNGIVDLGNGDGDVTNSKDLVGRVLIQPLAHTDLKSTIDLAVGVAVSSGRENGTVAAPAIPSYRTPGQITFFRYLSDGTAANTVIANGTRKRLSPQGYLNVGPLGLLAEYTRSSHNVQRTTSKARLDNKAWQLAGSWFLTGEKNSFKSVTPKRVFDPGAGAWGALELAGRYAALKVDDNAFPLYASLNSSASEAKSWGAGVNWHFARNIKLVLDYDRTTFTRGVATGDREPETFVSTRLQTAF